MATSAVPLETVLRARVRCLCTGDSDIFQRFGMRAEISKTPCPGLLICAHHLDCKDQIQDAVPCPWGSELVCPILHLNPTVRWRVAELGGERELVLCAGMSSRAHFFQLLTSLPPHTHSLPRGFGEARILLHWVV